MIRFQYNFPVPAGDDDYIDTMIALLKGVIPRWEAFGLYIHIDYDELQVINAGKLTAAECMMKLLVKWIELNAEKATIWVIIQACIGISNFDLAERLRNNDDIKKKLNMDGGMYSVDAHIMNNGCSFLIYLFL